MRLTKNFLFVLLFVLLGSVSGVLSNVYWPQLKQVLMPPGYVYVTQNESLLEQKHDAEKIGWGQLVSETEQALLLKYLPSDEEDFLAQLSRSTTAANDAEYQNALYSTDIIDTHLDKSISISGFIVPVDLTEDRKINSFFLVPYFGACIHYPPPPPNQIIYVRVPGQIPLIDMGQAFTLTGVLRGGLFEDILGTSAYQLELISITEFHDAPDDLRQH